MLEVGIEGKHVMSSAAGTSRPGPVRRLYNWVLNNATGRRAWALMAVIAFAESSFFPFPPDILLAPMLLADRRRALLLGAWCSLWSVLGGMLGYAIGHLLQPVAWWLINFYHMQADAVCFIGGFKRNLWIVALQGLTPVPYKIVTISAGIAGVSFWRFVLFSALTRSVRFVGEATLFYFFGDTAKYYIEKYMTPVLIIFFTLIVAGFVILHFLFSGPAC
jgi:membrane protein YqaA with SNARE-associated domain